MRMIQRIMKIPNEQRGVVAPLVAILIFVLVGFTAFAIDLGYSYMVKSELQNAADAAALAGASVLFNSNANCIDAERPFHCCTGPGTGSCDPSVIDADSVTLTARAVAMMNYSSGSPVISPANPSRNLTVEIGHYAFSSSWDSPGIFYPRNERPLTQMPGWQNISFSELNDPVTGEYFINAVRATVSRTDVPRFFSRIFDSSDRAVSVQATAYVGFAGTLAEGTADIPIAICKQAIVNDPDCEGAACIFSCVNGRMINSGGGATTNTGAWTNFTQDPCTTANPSNMPSSCSDSQPETLIFGQGMGTVGGQQTPVWNSVKNCWLKNCSDSPVSDPQNCTKQWSLTLPVIDCPSNNPGPCSKLVGAVTVNLLWIWTQNPDMDDGPIQMENWTCSSASPACSGLPACQGQNDLSNCKGNCCWNSFVTHFNLKNAGGVLATVGLPGSVLKPSDLKSTIFFKPECDGDIVAGGTGGENFGIMAQNPVLVKAEPVISGN